MSRTTGTVVDNSSVLQASRPRVRAGDHGQHHGKPGMPEFSKHVLMLERSADTLTGASHPRLPPRISHPDAEFQSRLSQAAFAMRHSSKSHANDHDTMPVLEQDGHAEADANGAAAIEAPLAENLKVSDPALRVAAGDAAMVPRNPLANGNESAAEPGLPGLSRAIGAASALASERAVADDAGMTLTNEPAKARDSQRGSTAGSSQPPSTQPRSLETAAARNRNDSGQVSVTMKVVRQETHLPLVPSNSPVAQIGEALAATLDGIDEPRSTPNLPGGTPARIPAGTVVRVLQIQLEPAELGSVTVRMSLEADTLELHIDAERAATAELIRRDQGALTSLLRSAGYEIDGLVVHVGEPDRSVSASTAPAQQGLQSASHSPTSSQPDGRSPSGSHPNSNREEAERSFARATDGSGDHHGRNPRARGIYV